MSTGMYTPGPWSVSDKNPLTVQAGKPPRSICNSGNGGALPWEQKIANARLIAVAPKLLESLREHVEWMAELRNTLIEHGVIEKSEVDHIDAILTRSGKVLLAAVQP